MAEEIKRLKNFFKCFIIIAVAAVFSFISGFSFASMSISKEEREAKREKEIQELQVCFKWWPTDAMPGPIKDPERGGYWWWPTRPGKIAPWGNRGHIYVYKIIFDYKEEELPPPKSKELRPSLLIKRIIKNVKVYFDFDKADLREDAVEILENAVSALKKNPEAFILITGNCDMRGSEAYNFKLGRRRAEAVKDFMLARDIGEERIRIVSRGKLDAVAPLTNLVGMQKDRNAQFLIAEVEEVMIPYPDESELAQAKEIEEGKYFIEMEQDIESQIKVSTREYIVKKDDTLWKIAEKELGSGHRWKYLYELNKKRIKDPNRLKAGQKLLIPVE